jgi:cytochrome P450
LNPGNSIEVSRDALVRELPPTLEEQAAWYHHMQRTQPVLYRPEYDLWEVFRYQDVQRVLRDHTAFSIESSLPEGFPSTLGKSDPPRHHHLRALVSKAFTPRRIESLAPRLRSLIDSLLEPAMVSGRMEVVTELTYPLPVRVIAELLGLPPEDQERFRMWSYQLLDQMIGRSQPDNSELLKYFAALLEKRQQDLRDDLISALLTAEEQGAHLSRDEIIWMCLELMMAGNVTTTMLLSNALLRLCRQPDLYATLQADPSLIVGMIEETLRCDFSTINLWRRARQDTLLEGCEIKAGQLVVAMVGAANFDENYFPHAEQFDLRRSPNPHMTFGHGLHMCLGAPLARLEGRIALERIVAHFSALRLDQERMQQFAGGQEQTVQPLPILLTPREQAT